MLTGVQIGPEIRLLDDEELEEPPLDELETPVEELLLNKPDEELLRDDEELLLEELLLDELDVELLLEELLRDELLLKELLLDELLREELLLEAGGIPPEEELLLNELEEELPKEVLEDIAAILPSDEFSIQARNSRSNRAHCRKSQ